MDSTLVGQGVRFPEGCDSLMEKCVQIMHTIDPIEKADLTLLLGEQWRASIQARKLTNGAANHQDEGQTERDPRIMDLGRATPPDIPLRPDTLEFVRPGYGVKVGRAGSLSSRIAILHALANVEQWAIDTALDNIARFGYYTQATAGTALKGMIPDEQEQEFVMPLRFFDDFVQMACDESKHFKWLNDRLEDQGAHYGDLPVHASIWDSCTDTARSALARMAVVHMTIESRGLDVNPATIARFDRSGDQDSAKMLQKVHEDEVTHVQIGHRWFCFLLKKHEGVGAESGNSSCNRAFGASGPRQDIDEDGDGDLYEFRQVPPAYATETKKPSVEQKQQASEGTAASSSSTGEVNTTTVVQAEEQVDPIEAQRRKRFQEVVVQYFKGSLKPPFNTVDREKGGLSRGWYEPLVVVRERTGFKPSGGRRALTRTEKEALAAKAAAEAAATAASSSEAATSTVDSEVIVVPGSKKEREEEKEEGELAPQSVLP